MAARGSLIHPAERKERVGTVEDITHNSILSGTARPLSGLVDYRPDSVVSREIVCKEAGTITLFAFDTGQGLSEHTAPFDALIYVVEGEAEIRISGSPARARAGEMIMLPANEPHAVKARQRFKIMLVMIRS